MKLFPKSKRAFTLVELLVVIAVFGLLASVVTSSTNSARSKARDATRLSQVREVVKAMDMFYDMYGYYPSTGAGNGTEDMVPTYWRMGVESLVNAGLIKATFGLNSPTEESSFLAGLKSFLLKEAHAVVMAWGPFQPSSIQDPFYKAEGDYPWSYGYRSYGPNIPGGTSFKIRVRLENLNHPVFNSSVSGVFLDANTSGSTACDASLGYYCISRGM